MFNIGDSVVYPMYGAGKLDSIEVKNLLGNEIRYYVLKMPGEVKVMIPMKNAESMGVRNVIDSEKANDVFKVLEKNEDVASQNWNKRYRENLDKLKTGNIYEVAEVVRTLSFSQKEKGSLSTSEKKMLNNARTILISELAISKQMPYEEVEQMVTNKIDMSYKENKEPIENMFDVHKSAVAKFIPYNQNN